MSQQRRVLIVDDDDDLRETLRLVLEMEGFVVATAEDGREALDYLRSSPLPAVMLLDLRMPVMDGWQTITALRDGGCLDKLPVVICTSAPVDAPQGFPILAKPIEFERLVAELSRILGE